MTLAEEMFNLNIECERRGGYHYYIDNADEIKCGGLRNWLLNTISVSNLLLDSQSLKDRILLEDVPSGQDDLAVILEAMKTNTQLRITYQSYWRDESFTFNVHPYCVKLFKQRWYLIAFSPNLDRIRIYALDRIFDICKLDGEMFTMPKDFYPEDFFYNYYGIIAGTKRKPEKVKLKVSAGQANYLRSLPLHHSQREVESNGDYTVFEYKIVPTDDFIQEILSHGRQLEVLSPEPFRRKIIDTIHKMLNFYE